MIVTHYDCVRSHEMHTKGNTNTQTSTNISMEFTNTSEATIKLVTANTSNSCIDHYVTMSVLSVAFLKSCSALLSRLNRTLAYIMYSFKAMQALRFTMKLLLCKWISRMTYFVQSFSNIRFIISVWITFVLLMLT